MKKRLASLWRRYLAWNRINDSARRYTDEVSWYTLIHISVVGLLRLLAMSSVVIAPCVAVKISFVDIYPSDTMAAIRLFITISLMCWIVAALLIVPMLLEPKSSDDL